MLRDFVFSPPRPNEHQDLKDRFRINFSKKLCVRCAFVVKFPQIAGGDFLTKLTKTQV
jgi:hypothetical protein